MSLDRPPRLFPAYLTTSWDDGHPLDLRLADLLERHGLTGTFYIPMTAERPTLQPAEIRALSQRFEIGAHTLHHVDLLAVSDERARREILESRAWIEEVTGKPCTMFCFPKGHFRREQLPAVAEAGYLAARTTEMTSLGCPRWVDGMGVALMPTTVQARPHPPTAYLRNWAKRRAAGNLWRWVRHGRTTDWSKLAEAMSELTVRDGGVFHLWGHSWEIEEEGQWWRLDQALGRLAELARHVPCLTNAEVCARCL